MSITDTPAPSPLRSGARAFARLDAERPAPRALPPQAKAAPEPVETVTLNRIGEFLELDFGRLFTWLRQGLLVAIILAVVGMVAGGAYSIFAKPKYTVSADILIDPANLQVVADDLYQAPGQVDGQLRNAGSKLRVLTSGNVLGRVVDELNLTADTEFYDPKPGFSLFPSGDAAPVDPRNAALGALAKAVTTKADDKSFVATLYVSAENSDKAIRISDAMIKAFQEELAGAEADGAARTAKALNDRLSEMKSSVKDAEEKVEAFKRENNLAASAGGELVSTQTMSQINQQLVDAQARVIAAQSSYDELLAAGRNATTADTQASSSLSALRANAGALQQQLDSQSMIYGPRHPTIVKLKTELGAVNAQLQTEIGRIVSAAKVSLDEAKSAVAALEAKSGQLTSTVFTDNDKLVQLRELERDAASKSAIYEAFLSRARQVTEREQIDTTNVRVISTAVPPPARSWPPRMVILLGAGAVGGFMLGMFLAVVLGMARDMRRPRGHVAA